MRVGINMDEAAVNPPVVKKFMIVNRKAPYGTIYALEALEVALISAAYEQELTLVFMDDGVYQLLKGMDTRGIEVNNFSKTYHALADMDIRKVYVERSSLERRGLTVDDLAIDVTVIDTSGLAELMAGQDVILSF